MPSGVQQLKDDLQDKAEQSGGSTLTQEAKEATAERLAEHLHDSGYNITSGEELKPKHIESYAESRLESVSERTVQNELSHIRGILEESGKDKMAQSDRLSNEALCGGKADRTPAREAPTPDKKEEIIGKAEQKDAGVAAALKMQDALGLRPREAVQGAASLKTWEQQLERGQRVTVVYGSKGGRPREVNPVDRQKALQAVKEAKQVAQERGGRLVQSQKGTLRAAMSRYNRVASQAGARGKHSPHSFRYSWTQQRVATYQQQGFSRQEARALTSQDLGHGDGRGRWVASVYGGGEA